MARSEAVKTWFYNLILWFYFVLFYLLFLPFLCATDQIKSLIYSNIGAVLKLMFKTTVPTSWSVLINGIKDVGIENNAG